MNLDRYKNENGKVDCESVFKASKELNIPLSELTRACNESGIRFDNCRLGLFGGTKSKLKPANEPTVQKFSKFFGGKMAISCQEMFEYSSDNGMGLLEATSCANSVGIKIQNCKLGCF